MVVRNHEVADKIVALFFPLRVWKDLWTRQIYSCYWNANVVWKRRRKKQLYSYFDLKRGCIYQPERLSRECLAVNGDIFFCKMCLRSDNDWMDEGRDAASSTLGLIGSLWNSQVCSCRTLVCSHSFPLHFLSFLCSIYFFLKERWFTFSIKLTSFLL